MAFFVYRSSSLLLLQCIHYSMPVHSQVCFKQSKSSSLNFLNECLTASYTLLWMYSFHISFLLMFPYINFNIIISAFLIIAPFPSTLYTLPYIVSSIVICKLMLQPVKRLYIWKIGGIGCQKWNNCGSSRLFRYWVWYIDLIGLINKGKGSTLGFVRMKQWVAILSRVKQEKEAY